MKTKTFVLVGIFLGINAMLGAWWYNTNAEQQARSNEIAQAYEVGDYKALNAIGLEDFTTLPAPSQEQVIVSLIKSNDLERAQDYLTHTTNRSENMRLYNKLITFTLQEDWDAVNRVVSGERTAIITLRALLIYFRALVAYHQGEADTAQVLLEQSLSLDGLAGATHLLGTKIAPRIEYRPRSKIDAYFTAAQNLGAVFGNEERYDWGVLKFYTGGHEEMKQFFSFIDDDTYQSAMRSAFVGRSILYEDRFDEAKQIFETIKQQDQESILSYLWLGRMYAEQEQLELAKNEYEQGLEKSRNWEILTDLLPVYDALGETEKIKLISYQIEQILGNNVTIHIGVLRRFIEIYEMSYLRKYADTAWKNYQNGRFEREDADERYESSVQTLYETIQDAYITLMVNDRQQRRVGIGSTYRDILLGMEDRSEIANIYLLLAFERLGDAEAMSRARGLVSEVEPRELGLIRVLNKIYLYEYAGASRELLAIQDELTDLDMLRLTWKIARGESRSIGSGERDLRQLLDATNEEFVSLEEGFDKHFASTLGKIGKYYEPRE